MKTNRISSINVSACTPLIDTFDRGYAIARLSHQLYEEQTMGQSTGGSRDMDLMDRKVRWVTWVMYVTMILVSRLDSIKEYLRCTVDRPTSSMTTLERRLIWCLEYSEMKKSAVFLTLQTIGK